MDSSRSLGRRCIGQNCHCDWRLTIYGCEEQTGAYIINMINIGMSALASLVGKFLILITHKHTHKHTHTHTHTIYIYIYIYIYISLFA
ncbi:hypothetical protein BC941DRAFT_187539 [Chlamydoabsidia padenii]|nr:hypothetical protein BC941DRAFT_187539 [Chlamydoabsidia padenii]